MGVEVRCLEGMESEAVELVEIVRWETCHAFRSCTGYV